MAEFTDRVKLVFEAVTGDAAGSVNKIKTSVGEAEGGFGKLKAAAGGAVEQISKSPAAMVAAGVAIGKVAFDLASGFEDAALNAQNFATASGLSVEEASRWQEVAGDLGVSTETLEGAVNKLNIAASKGALEQLGIGGDTTNDKLLNALTHLQGIDDATERARQGAQLFGKSWAQLAPLVEESGDLAANLAAVSDAKVIDEGEVAKAREMRDAMDKLSDTLDDIKLTLGEALIGPITDVANTLGNVVDIANTLKDATSGVGDVFRMLPGAGIPDMLDGLSRATDFSAGWDEQLKGVGQTLTANLPVVGGWVSGLFGSGDAADDAAQASARAESATRVHAQAMKDAAAAAEEERVNLEKLTAATLASFNSQLGLADAADKTDDAVSKYATSLAEAEAASFGNKDANDKLADSQREAEKAALAQASAAAKLASDQAIAATGSDEFVNKNAILANSLRTTAGTLAADSPLRKSLLEYAAQIEAVPDTAKTTFEADTATAAQQVDALYQNILKLSGKTFFTQLKLIGEGALNPTGSSANTSPSGTSSMAPAALGAPLSAASPGVGVAVPALAPRASAPATAPTIVVNVSVAPLTNPAEVGRQVADYLDAFYRRSGQRRPVAA